MERTTGTAPAGGRPGPSEGVGLADASAVLAALVATVLPLLGGLAMGWAPGRVALYLALAGAYLAFIRLYRGDTAAGRWLYAQPAAGFLGSGLLSAALVVVSGDGVIQPIAFSVPFVFALFNLGAAVAARVGALYMALLAAALWLGGERSAPGIVYPVGVYSALLVFMAGFVRLAQEQAIARARADALAAENARLADEAALAATLAERNRIARELHDTIAQGLTAVTMQLEAADRAFERDPARARARLARAQALARETLAEVRQSVWTLAAPAVEGARLGEALAALAARFGERTGLEAAYAHTGPPLDLDSERAVQLLRIAQEALQNVERHADARRVELGTRRDPDGAVALWVRDDGRGFDPEADQARADGGGFGLHSLRERARLAGGSLRIESEPGRGTTVTVSIPGE